MKKTKRRRARKGRKRAKRASPAVDVLVPDQRGITGVESAAGAPGPCYVAARVDPDGQGASLSVYGSSSGVARERASLGASSASPVVTPCPCVADGSRADPGDWNANLEAPSGTSPPGPSRTESCAGTRSRAGGGGASLHETGAAPASLAIERSTPSCAVNGPRSHASRAVGRDELDPTMDLTLPLAWHAPARQENKTVARAQGAWVVPEATTRAKAGAKHREITL